MKIWWLEGSEWKPSTLMDTGEGHTAINVWLQKTHWKLPRRGRHNQLPVEGKIRVFLIQLSWMHLCFQFLLCYISYSHCHTEKWEKGEAQFRPTAAFEVTVKIWTQLPSCSPAKRKSWCPNKCICNQSQWSLCDFALLSNHWHFSNRHCSCLSFWRCRQVPDKNHW